jgi:hypothetical protein
MRIDRQEKRQDFQTHTSYSVVSFRSMECKQQAITAVTAVRQTALACLLVSIVMTLLIGKCV